MSTLFSSSPMIAPTQTTRYRYSVEGLLEELACQNGEEEQVTRWVYGTEVEGDNGIARADLVREKVYPDGGGDRVAYAYNQLGEVIKQTDQNGTVHEYEYDDIGRLTLDSVTDLGEGVEGSVLAIGRSYTPRGQVEKVTSYS